MKKTFVAVIFLCAALAGHTQELLVAVMDFTARSGYSGEELENITELFAGFLLETRKVRVLTRSQWEVILKEHSFQRGGLVAETEIKRLGEALGAKAVVSGTLMKMGSNNILNLSLLDVESGEMQSAARKTFQSLDEFMVLLPALASDMVNLLQKAPPLTGRWKVDGQPITVVFNENGTFEFQDCKFIGWMGSGRVRSVTTSAGQTGYLHEYRLYSGRVQGSYTFTGSEITVSGRFSGTLERRQVWSDLSGDTRTGSENTAENFTASFGYKAEGNRLELSNCMFLRYGISRFEEDSRDYKWYGNYYTRLTKTQ